MKKLLIALMAALLMPSDAWGALCPFPDGKATKCEIPLCVQAGFPSSAGCRPALRVFIKRAFWGKPPVPLPPECMCSWIPQVVIPTDKNGIPFFLEDSIPFGAIEGTVQYADAGSLQQTPFEKPVKQEPLKLTPYTQLASSKVTNPTQDQIAARTRKIIRGQEAYRTNCNTGMFRRGNRGTCYIISADERIDLEVKRDCYRRRFGSCRRYQYDYNVKSGKLNGTGDVYETRMRIRHKTLSSCQIFVNGRAISDAKCNVSDLHSVVATPPVDTPTEPTNPSTTPDQPNEIQKPKDNGVMVFE